MNDEAANNRRNETSALREANARMLSPAFEREQQNESLRESERRFRAAFDFAAIGMALVGLDGRFVQANHALCQMLGYDESALLALTFQDITHPDDLDVDLGLVQRVLDGDIQTYNLEKRYYHRDGHLVWILLTVALVRDRRENPLYFISQIQDITAAKATDLALRESESRFARILETVDDAIVIVNAAGRLVMANEEVELALGLDRQTNLGQRYEELTWNITASDGSPLPLQERPIGRVMLTREPIHAVEACFHTPGRVVHGLVNATPILTEDGKFDGVVAIVRDITHRKQLERALAHRAMHDPLTGLPNRALFVDRVQQALASVRRNGGGVAVLYLDLNNFKPVNDTWGHAAGDELLMQIAERLDMELREEDTAARMGGDEFAILLRGLTPTADLTEIGERLSNAVGRPILLDSIEGDTIQITPAIGIAVSDGANEDPSDLLRRADAAMYQAKRTGAHTIVVYDDGTEAVIL